MIHDGVDLRAPGSALAAGMRRIGKKRRRDERPRGLAHVLVIDRAFVRHLARGFLCAIGLVGCFHGPRRRTADAKRQAAEWLETNAKTSNTAVA